MPIPRPDAMALDIVIEAGPWEEPHLTALADRAAGAALAELGLGSDDWDITLLACDDGRIAALNGDFRDKPKATNVLSWPSAERGAGLPGAAPAAPEPDAFGDTHLGDIAISFDTCAREAQAGGIAFDDHVTHLVVHAVLHLLGYDHETDPDAILMEGIETRVLGKLGIADPYRM